MGKKAFMQFLKDTVYKVILPIFLWSINFKTLDDYIANIIFMETGGFPEWHMEKLVLPRVLFSLEIPFYREDKLKENILLATGNRE